ncbi:GtrA family protein [Saccharomonospora sp. NPDC006951]
MTAAPVSGSRLPDRNRELGRDAFLYVTAGCVTTIAQALLYLLLREPVGAHAANLVTIALTTVANTEFHRRITFAGAIDAPARRHVQTAATFVFYALAGTGVLMLVQATVPEPSPALESLALVTASLAGGAVRFVLLRSWVFIRDVRMAS